MNKVAIIGVGTSKFGKFRDSTIVDIGHQAVLSAIRDSSIPFNKIEAAYCGRGRGGRVSGQVVLKDLGLTGIPVINFENACSSGSTALHQAYKDISHGIYDVVLVFGVEQLTKIIKGSLPLEQDDIEVIHGMNMPPILYAMRAKRYMFEFGLTREQLAMVSVKSHKNASLNPNAQYRNEVTLDEVLNSRLIADPLTLLQCCPIGDGAAAAIVCSSKVAPKYNSKGVYIAASVLTSGKYEPGYRDMTCPEITTRAAAQAYEMAGCTPADIDVAQVHDAFTISELLYYDALGFCQRGQAGELIQREETSINGRIPVNTDGGLLSKGHPLGATGVSQVVETYWQLRGKAGSRQVKSGKAFAGLTHATGGGVSGLDHGACTIHILTR